MAACKAGWVPSMSSIAASDRSPAGKSRGDTGVTLPRERMIFRRRVSSSISRMETGETLPSSMGISEVSTWRFCMLRRIKWPCSSSAMRPKNLVRAPRTAMAASMFEAEPPACMLNTDASTRRSSRRGQTKSRSTVARPTPTTTSVFVVDCRAVLFRAGAGFRRAGCLGTPSWYHRRGLLGLFGVAVRILRSRSRQQGTSLRLLQIDVALESRHRLRTARVGKVRAAQVVQQLRAVGGVSRVVRQRLELVDGVTVEFGLVIEKAGQQREILAQLAAPGLLRPVLDDFERAGVLVLLHFCGDFLVLVGHARDDVGGQVGRNHRGRQAFVGRQRNFRVAVFAGSDQIEQEARVLDGGVRLFPSGGFLGTALPQFGFTRLSMGQQTARQSRHIR